MNELAVLESSAIFAQYFARRSTRRAANSRARIDSCAITQTGHSKAPHLLLRAALEINPWRQR